MEIQLKCDINHRPNGAGARVTKGYEHSEVQSHPPLCNGQHSIFFSVMIYIIQTHVKNPVIIRQVNHLFSPSQEREAP